MVTINIVVIGDIHYVNNARHSCSIPTRHSKLGLELLYKALAYAKDHIKAQAVVLLGDIVDNGDAELADKDLYEIKQVLDSSELRYFVVPGNHDGDFERFRRIFKSEPGIEDIEGVKLFFFHDEYGANDVSIRSPEAMSGFIGSSRPIIAFQHNPIYPQLNTKYPYNLANSYDAMKKYESLGVNLSVSAHYHKGIEPTLNNGVQYVTCPALCESPFKMLHISIDGQDIKAEEIALKSDESTGLQDIHIHTQFAYCSENMEVNSAIERGKLLGLKNMVFTEHSSHLYIEREKLGSNKVFQDISYLRYVRDKALDRMQLYREDMSQVHSDFLKIGLEVDCTFDGSPMLLEEDMKGWDLLIGAVHRLPCTMIEPQGYIINKFLDIHELFLSSGIIRVLAHPFRIFDWANMLPPKELYKPFARLLVETRVAAEINFHTNFPDEEFFRVCLEEGVKLALGSDAHNLFEVGYLLPHINFLTTLGVDPLDKNVFFSL